MFDLERIAIDITSGKINYLQAEKGRVKLPVKIMDLKDFIEQDKVIINAAISIIKAKTEEQK